MEVVGPGGLGAKISLRWIPVDRGAGPEEPVLSAPERERAIRMKHEGARATFVTARRELRRLIGAELGVEPEALSIRIREDGKPEVEGPLEVNLSHSGGMILLGWTTVGPLGVDVEWKDPGRERAALARRFFSEAEQARLVRRPEDFEQIWTAKEAVLKATGLGIRVRLHGVCTAEVQDDWRRETSTGAVVRRVEAPKGYAASVGYVPEDGGPYVPAVWDVAVEG